ncbi:MAG: hypothetical protein LAO56_01615 [Acidobacteriia bacterium]|nr:hypothetical protein [Terriglobia bacterium]
MLRTMGSAGVVVAEDTHGREKSRKSGWLWPVGVMATGFAGVVLVALRGCWHRRMSWPVRMQGHAYQVCLGCGAKRLFDEEHFRAYGPYRYDLNELIAWKKASNTEKRTLPHVERPAS